MIMSSYHFDPPIILTAFISTWATTTSNETVTFPLTSDGIYSFDIDWGDGSAISHITTNVCSHTYTTAGNHLVTVEGTMQGFQFNNAGDKDKIIDISNWGCFDIHNGREFLNCLNLHVSATDSPTISAGQLVYNFAGCISLGKINLKLWNTGNIALWWSTFEGAVNAEPNTSHMKTTFLTTMQNTFLNATKANPDLSRSYLGRINSMSGFAMNAGMSTANYDALLNKLASYTFGFQGIIYLTVLPTKYSQAGADSRYYLINSSPIWNIGDGGQV